ncbi:hypothetical protein CIB84_013888 [Bambusicola thoracicus]|uniref:Uncharacterized protein n=1 Tax=Bambusicola thoracicus TaxID=9083 RepID=A0A2P4SE21_BAMTH|nr:hypothetical protein CIB84_013888 [Bambusicola thoracicus]
MLCLLAEHRCCADPDPDSNRDGRLDYEYILGNGHGHSCK